MPGQKTSRFRRRFSNRRGAHENLTRRVDVEPRPRGRGWSGWIMDPKWVSVLCALSWLLVTLAGWSAMHNPPTSIASELGPYITGAWSILFIAGGIFAIVGALPGWWYLERVGIILLVAGLAVYDGVVWYLHLTADSGNRAVQAYIVAALISLAAARFARISGAALDPGRGPEHLVTAPVEIEDERRGST